MAASRSSRIDRLTTPLTVTLAVSVVWAVWAVGVVHREPVGQLVHAGADFLEQGAGASRTIDNHHVIVVGPTGYDGQFLYYVALDPRNAPAYMDEPSYRYSRILYPFVARASALGRPAAVPWTLFLVNLVAVAGGTFALALLLRRRGASPAYAALFGLAPGLYVAVAHDLSEPLAYALAAAGLAAWWWDEHPRPWLAGILFGLAGLTRETTLLFPVALAAASLLGLTDSPEGARKRDLRTASVLAGVSLVPYVVLRAALLGWLGTDGATPEAAHFALFPFGGILGHWPLNDSMLEQLWAVVIPSIACVVLVYALTRRIGPSLLALMLNVAVLVIFLPTHSYDSVVASSRIALGVTCAFVACLPLLPARHRATVALVIAIFAMSPWYDLFPTAFGR